MSCLWSLTEYRLGIQTSGTSFNSLPCGFVLKAPSPIHQHSCRPDTSIEERKKTRKWRWGCLSSPLEWRIRTWLFIAGILSEDFAFQPGKRVNIDSVMQRDCSLLPCRHPWWPNFVRRSCWYVPIISTSGGGDQMAGSMAGRRLTCPGF